MRDTWVPINISFTEALNNGVKKRQINDVLSSWLISALLSKHACPFAKVKTVFEVIRDISPAATFYLEHTKLLCCEAHLLIHELYPHCRAASRRWAVLSISFVGCLQVLYLGMFGCYSLAFRPLCSQTINNRLSVCTCVRLW